jgi:hypothetical protein
MLFCELEARQVFLKEGVIRNIKGVVVVVVVIVVAAVAVYCFFVCFGICSYFTKY